MESGEIKVETLDPDEDFEPGEINVETLYPDVGNIEGTTLDADEDFEPGPIEVESLNDDDSYYNDGGNIEEITDDYYNENFRQ